MVKKFIMFDREVKRFLLGNRFKINNWRLKLQNFKIYERKCKDTAYFGWKDNQLIICRKLLWIHQLILVEGRINSKFPENSQEETKASTSH
jgi:hypothetical protein